MSHSSLQPIKIVKSEQEKVSWLRALLRRKRKDDGKSRVVLFVNTEEWRLHCMQRCASRLPSR